MEKAISIAYSACVSVALVIQHAKRMRRVMLSFVACLTLPYFATSQKEHDFSRKVWNINCFSLQRIPETSLIMRIERDIIIYISVSQPLRDRGPVNSFFIRRGPGPNKFTRNYLPIFLSSYIKLT